MHKEPYWVLLPKSSHTPNTILFLANMMNWAFILSCAEDARPNARKYDFIVVLEKMLIMCAQNLSSCVRSKHKRSTR